MNKLTKIFSCFLVLVNLLLNFQFAFATFGVSTGDSFTYDCIAAERSIIWGTHTSTTEGYEIDDQHFDVGTSFNVEVDSVTSSEVFYTVSKEGYEIAYFSSLFDFLFTSMFNYCFNIMLLKSYVVEEEWNQTLFDDETGLPIDLLFIETNSTTWIEIIELADYLNGLYTDATLDDEYHLLADYEDYKKVFICDIHLFGGLNTTYTSASSPAIWIEYSNDLDYHYTFAYEKKTGGLLAMRLHGSISGVRNETVYDIMLDTYVERDDYDLPTNIHGSSGLPGFTAMLALGSISVLLMIAIYVRKRIDIKKIN